MSELCPMVFDNFEVVLAARTSAALRRHAVLVAPAAGPEVAMRLKMMVRIYCGFFRANLPPRPVQKA